MNRRNILSISMMTALGLVILSDGAIAQQKSLKEQIVGTWMLVSSDTVQPNGTRTPTFGPNPKGIAIFDAGGRYAFAFTNSSLPKFAGNNRLNATAEENKAVVQGSLADSVQRVVDLARADSRCTPVISAAQAVS